jgi:hypothetical protein
MKQLWHLNSMESLLTNAEGNPAIHDYMYGRGGHYARWKKDWKSKTNTLWSHTYVESKIVNHIEAQSTKAVYRSKGWPEKKKTETDKNGK